MSDGSFFSKNIMEQKYSHVKPDGGKETWEEIAHRVATNVMGAVDVDQTIVNKIEKIIAEKKFMPGGRYLYASGRPFAQTQNCLLLKAEDSREGWADVSHKAVMALCTGAGIGIDYSDIRPEGALIRRTGGTATGPMALAKMVNEIGRQVMQGGSRRSAIWAGLNWNHADIFKFIESKNWSEEVRAMKEKDFNFPATLDGTNISVLLDDLFFEAFHNSAHVLHQKAKDVYWKTLKQALKTAEPGFSVDVGKNSGETLRNACTEVTTSDDSDICNLGSINLSKISSLEEMAEIVDLATQFLLAGTVYSVVPYEKVGQVREKNRRLGLGLMGIHEWLLQRDKQYAPDTELEEYLKIYATSTNVAHRYADKWNISRPVKTRAIAPTGTIGIVAETTTGIEPIFCVAYKRRYLKGLTWHYEYVIDPTAKRLIDQGHKPSHIEDSYALANDIERRVAFQSWVQQYVDHGISSTINLPSWGTEINNSDTIKTIGDMFIKYLPHVRGLTVYPDGARGGQPLTPVSLETALNGQNEVFVEQFDMCDLTKGGTCGS